MMATLPAPPMAAIRASPASLPPARLSVATWLTTFTSGPVRAAMSAVNTGMPALLASAMAVPIDLLSHGQRMMAATCLTMKSDTWSRWRAGSISPATTTTSMSCLAASALMARPMSTKNGLVSVSSETPIVPLEAASAGPAAKRVSTAARATAIVRRVHGREDTGGGAALGSEPE